MKENGIPTRAYIGCATFDNDFRIRVGDEGIYRIIDEGKCFPYSLLLLIHPKELDEFCQVVRELKEFELSEGTVLLRLEDGQFYPSYYKVEHRGIPFMDGALYQIRFYNIKAFEEVTTKQKYEIMDYRAILSLSKNLYFSYDFSSTIFTYYWLSGNQEVIAGSKPILEWKEEVLSCSYVKEEGEIILGGLCEDLITGKSNLYYQLVNSILSSGKENVRWILRGSAVYEKMNLARIVGVIEVEKLEEGSHNDFFADLMNRDALTGLLNKRAITQLADQKLQYAGSEKFRFLILDVDNFKTINDTYGHMFGDEAILKVSNIVRKMVGSHGVVGRIGGDELFAILENVEDEKSLRNVLKAIRENVAYAYVGSKNNIHVTCSMGCVEYPTDGTTYKELFQKADYSLYLAKEKGKNRYIIYDPLKHGEICLKQGTLSMDSMYTGSSKTKDFSDMITLLYQKRVDAVEEVFQKLGALYQLEKINVFWGENLLLKMHWGTTYSEDQDGKYVLEKGYLKNFSNTGVIVLDNMNIGKSLQAYQVFTRQKLTFIMQFLMKREEEILGVISFERIIRKSKMSTIDINNLELISHLLGEILLEAM